MVREFDAIIFDLDGVICYTDEYHYRAWKAIADNNGIPFDPTQSAGTTAEFEDLDLGGMGIELIRQSAKKMTYVREGNYNILTLYFEFNASHKRKKEDTVT